MNLLADTMWFMLCGAREQLVRMGAYGLAGLVFSVYSDVMGTHGDTVWRRGAGLMAVGMLLALLILVTSRRHGSLVVREDAHSGRRTTRTNPALPKSIHACRDVALFAFISAAQLFGSGIGQAIIGGGSHQPEERPVSLFATLIPELERLRGAVVDVRRDLGHIERKLDNVKQETSADPRKELANLGADWTPDAFFGAIQRGDRRAVDLFVAGGMATRVPDSQGRPLPVMLAMNESNPGEMLDALMAGNLDINASYEVSGPAGGLRTTLLGRAIEKGNLPLVESLVRHQVHLDDSLQTFGSMGMPRDTYPLASALYWQHLDIAELLLKAGADPSVGDFAAYREATVLQQKPSLPREEADRLAALTSAIAPTGEALERLQAETRLRVVEQQITAVALQGLRAPPGSAEKAQFDRQYDALQEERAKLRAQLGLEKH